MPDSTPSGKARPAVLALLAGIAAVWLGFDQLTKWVVLTNLPEGQPVPVLGDVLQWHFVRNAGAAFSIFVNMTWLLTLVAVAVIIAIILFARRIRSPWWALVLGLVLGGALGNLIDRLFREPGFGRGHVIDFISTPWMMPAIYNVADIGVVVGMVLLVLLTLLDVRLDGTRGRRGQDAVARQDAAALDAATQDAVAQDATTQDAVALDAETRPERPSGEA